VYVEEVALAVTVTVNVSPASRAEPSIVTDVARKLLSKVIETSPAAWSDAKSETTMLSTPVTKELNVAEEAAPVTSVEADVAVFVI